MQWLCGKGQTKSHCVTRRVIIKQVAVTDNHLIMERRIWGLGHSSMRPCVATTLKSLYTIPLPALTFPISLTGSWHRQWRKSQHASQPILSWGLYCVATYRPRSEGINRTAEVHQKISFAVFGLFKPWNHHTLWLTCCNLWFDLIIWTGHGKSCGTVSLSLCGLHEGQTEVSRRAMPESTTR